MRWLFPFLFRLETTNIYTPVPDRDFYADCVLIYLTSNLVDVLHLVSTNKGSFISRTPRDINGTDNVHIPLCTDFTDTAALGISQRFCK